MTDYRSRVVDGELARQMAAMGAVLIDGPKALGKTRTAEEVARTVFRMDVDRAARAALEVAPEQLFASPTRSCSTSGRKPRNCGISCVAQSMTTQ